MVKLTAMLHTMVSGLKGLTDNQAGELHDLVEQVGAELEQHVETAVAAAVGKLVEQVAPELEQHVETTVAAAVGKALNAAATENTTAPTTPAAPAEPAEPVTETSGDAAAGA
jgi:hypothetical protein